MEVSDTNESQDKQRVARKLLFEVLGSFIALASHQSCISSRIPDLEEPI